MRGFRKDRLACIMAGDGKDKGEGKKRVLKERSRSCARVEMRSWQVDGQMAEGKSGTRTTWDLDD